MFRVALIDPNGRKADAATYQKVHDSREQAEAQLDAAGAEFPDSTLEVQELVANDDDTSTWKAVK